MKIITKLLLTLLYLATLGGCVLFHGYTPPIQQGNIITADKVARLQNGMSREQVLAIMGTPVYINTFRDNQWDYVYTYQKFGHRLEASRVIVHFNDGQVDSINRELDPRMEALKL